MPTSPRDPAASSSGPSSERRDSTPDPRGNGRGRRRTVGVTAASLLALAGVTALSPAAAGDPTSQAVPTGPAGPTGAARGELPQEAAGQERTGLDRDTRRGSAAPTSAQRSAAKGLQVTWNDLGTPGSLLAGGRADRAVLADGLPSEPVAAARAYLAGRRDLFGLSGADVDALEVLTTAKVGTGSVVILRQQFGDLPAAVDGLVSVGVTGGRVVSVSSSLSRQTAAPAPATLPEARAVDVARGETGLAADAVATSRTRMVAVPTADGARAAYEVVLIGKDMASPLARTTYVDARDGTVLVSENLVDHASSGAAGAARSAGVGADVDNPTWRVFPANPPADYSSTDTRTTWCWTPAPGCTLPVSNPASPLAWDVDGATRLSTLTTKGNNALGVDKWNSDNAFAVGVSPAAPRADRNYRYPWTNQWNRERCAPTVFATPQANDRDASVANLFAMHNRMHDWSYQLGFTEAAWNLQQENFDRPGRELDYEQGNAQAGAIPGGPPNFTARDNANQITPPDGIAPITNMYLWQPIAGSFYAPCVDGDYDMSVIGHEYTHAITNRMIAGPDAGYRGPQAGAMGESWSDLFAMEYLAEHGFRPAGDTPYVIGGYATGDRRAGIRNYDMSRSPLNYSDVGYDVTGPQVHADGEIWSATNFALRAAMTARYGAGDAAAQLACAEGRTPVGSCPGNRRWIQLHFDSLLLTARSDVTMVDMRNALLAADLLRFGGANQDLIWDTFARRGLGVGAFSRPIADPNGNLNADPDPVPSFASPYARTAQVRLRPTGDAAGAPVKLFIGRYEGRAVPVADTDPATPLGDTATMVPGRYDAVAQGPGFGHRRFTLTVRPGGRQNATVRLRRNLASAAAGATASGDGGNLDRLVDDTEATNWAALDGPVAGRTVTVDLAGDRAERVRRIQVSALLRPADPQDAFDKDPQNRFTALRSFELLACNAAAGADCSSDAGYRSVWRSPADAFPARRPRPRAPELALRSFAVPATSATHLRLRVLANQCTGGPDFAGEQDADPRAVDDCTTGAPSVARVVRAAEFQAFRR